MQRDRATPGQEPDIPLERKVAFLRDPLAYPDRPGRVDTVETHMAWVFLTDRYAFKLKKPARYDSLDFSTLDARQRTCEEELRLNRRLAPDVYLDIVPLILRADGELALGGEGRVIDWLVKMRRLPADRMLDRAIAQGEAAAEDVRALATLLADFYQRLQPVEIDAADYRSTFVAEMDVTRKAVASLNDPTRQNRLESIHRRLLSFLADRAGLFERRLAEKRIVEGHGDLRPEHVYLDGVPRIIDCLEFSRPLRVLDAADELGYLSLECERLGAAWIGPILFETYGARTGDRPPPELIDFYKCFRATVRFRIAILHMAEPGRMTAAQWLARADVYAALAERYAAKLACGPACGAEPCHSELPPPPAPSREGRGSRNL
jgi:aminoglycoside phosphotransferase family enzyme